MLKKMAKTWLSRCHGLAEKVATLPLQVPVMHGVAWHMTLSETFEFRYLSF